MKKPARKQKRKRVSTASRKQQKQRKPTATLFRPGFSMNYKMRPNSATNPFTIFKGNNIARPLDKRIRKKDLNYNQAKRRYPKLSPYIDTDGDGIINIFDCKPFDRKRRGPQHENQSDMAKLLRERQEAAMSISEEEMMDDEEVESKKNKKSKSNPKSKPTGFFKKTYNDSKATKVTTKATLGFLKAFTGTGGIGGEGEYLLPIEQTDDPLKSKKSKKGKKGKGRPEGTYKYGIPIEEYKERERKEKMQERFAKEAAKDEIRKLELMRLNQQLEEKRKQLEYEKRTPYISTPPVYNQDVTEYAPRAPPPEYEPDGIDEIETVEQNFETNQPPRQMPEQDPREMERMMVQQQMEQERMRKLDQSVPATVMPGQDTSGYSKIRQPQRQNPWSLLSKWRPNLNMNVFKRRTNNLMTDGTRILQSKGGGM